MAQRLGLTGNDAVAYGMRQVNPDVIAAYPITPQTEMMHEYAPASPGCADGFR